MIKLIKSTFYNERETKRALCSFISSAEHLSFGKECESFEKSFSKWQKRKYCISLNSGSSANLAIVQALLNLNKIKRGDKVGFSALTWSTNVMPLIQLGLQPIPVDIEIDTLNVSSRTLEIILKKHRLKMLFLTDLLGFCSDIDAIKTICDRNKIILIEDACEALGSVYKGKKLGNFGLASTFSFYVGHHMSTIEGGMIATDNERLATMIKLVRAHGWDRNLTESRQVAIRNKFKINSRFYSRYTFYAPGYNLRPTEITGFIGNFQMQYLNELIAKRRENFLSLARVLYQRTDRYYPIRFEHLDLVSNFAVPIICKTRAIRDELVERCKDVVEIRPIVGGDMTRQPFYVKHMRKYANILGDSCARLAHEQGLYFGNNPELTKKELDQLVEIFG